MEFSRTIGFSTGALAYSDFRRALQMLDEENIGTVELSALRMAEWEPLLRALDGLDLSRFEFCSLHLPSLMNVEEERRVAQSAQTLLWREWPLILHPDAISDFGLWRELGPLLCIENMDKRKPIGRTASELDLIFDQLPEAKFCFDIGHAWQVDPTMTEAYWILKCHRERLVQVHVSEVNSRSKHDTLSYTTIQSFRDIAHMIPPAAPLILETPVSQERMRGEIEKARFALLPLTVDQLVA
jgi:hypothetical protein